MQQFLGLPEADVSFFESQFTDAFLLTVATFNALPEAIALGIFKKITSLQCQG